VRERAGARGAPLCKVRFRHGSVSCHDGFAQLTSAACRPSAHVGQIGLIDYTIAAAVPGHVRMHQERAGQHAGQYERIGRGKLWASLARHAPTRTHAARALWPRSFHSAWKAPCPLSNASMRANFGYRGPRRCKSNRAFVNCITPGVTVRRCPGGEATLNRVLNVDV
jgi:hypothetical protein